ncbi:hypothetical protein HNQ02_003856 [Flavobacterium sp. 7E]|uniref:hypothetical protein n=1 Tax=Flavobacterium sp. 7E TaxID=2735898 RepID=UPI0015715087|nr:hypothetical protein [Flavobacterium sp. 7E]NRS90905.1 hypothetical protein [Flavobacterium sp. 7E]
MEKKATIIKQNFPLKVQRKIRQHYILQRVAACGSGELRDRDFSAKIKIIAEDKRELTTYLAIFANRCYEQVLFPQIF